MSEQKKERGTDACPAWCSSTAGNSATHSHVSRDVVVEATGRPLLGRMIQMAGTDEVRLLIDDSVATLEQAETFARAILHLAAEARLAPPGLGFVADLAAKAGVSTRELAMAAGLDPQRVKAQRAGGQVLAPGEYDRLALAAAKLYADATATTATAATGNTADAAGATVTAAPLKR
ncbi:MAG: hypothetical protein ACXVXC_16385 [Nocardioidaceae bacterium]